MALSAQEQAEMDALQKEVGHLAPVQASSGLTPDEQKEMASLQQEVGHLAGPDQSNPNQMTGQNLLNFMRSGKDQSQRGQATMSTGLGQTVLEHGGNAIAAGYLPQLQAAAEPVTNAIGNAVTGNNVDPTPYLAVRDRTTNRLNEQAKANPVAAGVADVGGTAIGALATPIPGAGGAAKGILGGIGKGMLGGAVQGAIQNPGDVAGKVNPLQLPERAENAAFGGIVGGVTGGVTEGVRSGLKAMSSPSLKKTAGEQAVQASGAMLKDFRVLNGKNQTEKLGQFGLDKGIVQAGDTVDTIAEKANAVRKDAGSKLEQIYNGVVEDFNKGGAANNLSAAEKSALNDSGFNPARDKKQLLSEVSKSMGNQEGKSGAVERLSKYLDQLIEDHGDKTLDPKTSQDIKTEIDKVAGWARNPLTKEPATESAFKEARRIISSKIDDDINRLGKLSGNPEALAQLKAANSDYGNAKQLHVIASDYVNRTLANNQLGLTDKIAGGAGLVAGTAAAGALGAHDPKSVGGAGLAVGALSAAANHYGKRYGSSLIASGANALSKAPNISGAAGLLPNAGLMGRSAVGLMRKGKLDERQD